MKGARASLLLAQKQQHQQLVDVLSEGRDDDPSFNPRAEPSLRTPGSVAGASRRGTAHDNEAERLLLDSLLCGPSLKQAQMLELADKGACDLHVLVLRGTLSFAQALLVLLPFCFPATCIGSHMAERL